MKRLLFVFTAILLITSLASAQWGQGKMSVGVGGELALPLGSWGDVAGIGIGGLGLFQYGLNEDILLTGQVGYTMWGEKDFIGAKYSASALTFLAGAKYDLSKNVTKGFYGLLQVGIYSLTQEIEFPQTTFFGIITPGYSVSSTSSEFVILPGVGYQFDNFDISAKYTIKGDFGNLCLNVLYVIPL